MSNMFTGAELRWIKELTEEEIGRRKDKGDYEAYTYDKDIFESILKKIDTEL